MTAINLSIVIPTRERHDVLAECLRTVVSQDYPDCEIIVSDNNGNDNTRRVVEGLADRRVRYINTGRRVSMSENWEFGLKAANGTFVTYIGDDDGFIPGAVGAAMAILEKNGTNALVWKKVEYCWPDYISASQKNWFSLPNCGYGLRRYQGRKKLRQVMAGRDGYNALPCLYNGIVRKSLIDGLRGGSTNGVFFNAMSPDVFSGIALSQAVGTYLYTHYPFSVNGASRHSIGTSYRLEKAADSPSAPKAMYISENACTYDGRLLMAPAIITAIMGEYLQVKKFLPRLDLPEPDWNHYVKALLRSASASLFPEEILESARHTVGQCGLARPAFPSPTRHEPASPGIGFVPGSFDFTAPNDMVHTIYDASRLVAGMMPSPSGLGVVSPFRVFASRILDCLKTEAKTLYRSL